MTSRSGRLLPALALSLLVAGCGSSGDHDTPDAASVAATQSLPARWWKWTESDPEQNPVADPTGAQCAKHQPGDVWFLAGTYGGAATRSCAVPSGRAVYFPVLNAICATDGKDPATVIAECTLGKPDRAEATLDGKPLDVVAASSGGSFEIVTRDGSALFEPAGAYEVVTTGLWVGPLALSDGQHTIVIKGRSGEFGLNVVYRLTVA